MVGHDAGTTLVAIAAAPFSFPVSAIQKWLALLVSCGNAAAPDLYSTAVSVSNMAEAKLNLAWWEERARRAGDAPGLYWPARDLDAHQPGPASHSLAVEPEQVAKLKALAQAGNLPMVLVALVSRALAAALGRREVPVLLDLDTTPRFYCAEHRRGSWRSLVTAAQAHLDDKERCPDLSRGELQYRLGTALTPVAVVGCPTRPAPSLAGSAQAGHMPGACCELAVQISTTNDTTRLSLSTVHLHPGTLAILADIISAVIKIAAEHPDADHETFSCLSSSEQRMVTGGWSLIGERAPELPLHRMIEAQCDRTPDAIALQDEYGPMSYRELESAANNLAIGLQRRGVGQGDVVGVLHDRERRLVVSFFAIMKLGGVYLPLDLSFPADRMTYMLTQAQAKVLLGDGQRPTWLIGNIIFANLPICIQPIPRISADTRPADPLYVMFTSGSTGRPKGVVAHNEGIVNYLYFCLQNYVRGPGGAPMFSSPAYDMAVPNLFVPLLSGQRVFLVPGKHGAFETAEMLASNGPFAFIKLTPGHLSMLTHVLSERRFVLSRLMCVGADSFSRDNLNTFCAGRADLAILNEYGPTEASVANSVLWIDKPVSQDLVPIGKPIPNTTMYVLGEDLKPVPVGVAGELYIGGVCVAPGYLHLPVVTAERFLPDPYAPPGLRDGPPRMYRTGDIGRWLPDGDLEFLGRKDDQVKVLGYRVEPAEVEAALTDLADVSTAAVLAIGSEPTSKVLVAYYTSERELDKRSLRQGLQQRIPSHAIPGRFVRVPELPLTVNGKVDRSALALMRSPAARHAGPASEGPLGELAARFAQVEEPARSWQQCGGTYTGLVAFLAAASDELHVRTTATLWAGLSLADLLNSFVAIEAE
ncbi:MAG TPA: amino acid adenylation domain-containing protein [Streptosporangiaceae bacterium]|nr:amino acid adenylation domain-containing protein [Streptosporangiaceae bacterium]